MLAFFLWPPPYIILIPRCSLFCLFTLLEIVFQWQRKRMHQRQWMTLSWLMEGRYWRTTKHWESARALYVISLEELQLCMLLSALLQKKEQVNVIGILWIMLLIYFVFIISLSFHPYALIHVCNCCILNSLMLLWLGTEKKTPNAPKENTCHCTILWFAYFKCGTLHNWVWLVNRLLFSIRSCIITVGLVNQFLLSDFFSGLTLVEAAGNSVCDQDARIFVSPFLHWWSGIHNITSLLSACWEVFRVFFL